MGREISKKSSFILIFNYYFLFSVFKTIISLNTTLKNTQNDIFFIITNPVLSNYYVSINPSILKSITTLLSFLKVG